MNTFIPICRNCGKEIDWRWNDRPSKKHPRGYWEPLERGETERHRCMDPTEAVRRKDHNEQVFKRIEAERAGIIPDPSIKPPWDDS